MTVQTSKGFDCLPYDILSEIAELLYATEVKHKGCSKFRATWVLSRVNRRLRELVLPLLYREVILKPQNNLTAAITCFLPGGQINELSTSVRSLRMWHNLPCRFDFHDLRLVEGNFPFTCLTEFDFPDSVLDDTIMEALGNCMQLRILAIACTPRWSIRWRIQDILKLLPSLKELRLQTNGLRVLRWELPHTLTYNSITTLSLRDSLPEIYTLGPCFAETCRFPNLIVFLIQGFVHPINQLFQFVHNHPTLLEVSISTHACYTRVEALLKLIDGTGTWMTIENPEVIGLNTQLCNIRGEQSDGTMPSNLFPPNIVPGVYVDCESFSFTRSHIHPNNIHRHSSLGPSHPCYKLVRLAMTGLRQRPVTQDGLLGDDATSIFRALEHVSYAAPDLEELRLHVIDGTCTSRFMEWTDVLKREVLCNFQRLRKLALYWDIRAMLFLPRWGLPSSLLSRSLRECYIPLLDDATPPVQPSRAQGKVTALDDLRHTSLGMDETAAGVREVLQIPDEEELDIYDDTLLMRAWETRNKDYADETARKFASVCPQLMTFDWYFLSGRPYLALGIDDHWVVSWSYKFQRRSSGNSRLVNFSSALRCTGCLLGDPTPLYPFVGQELERAIKLGRRAWVPFRKPAPEDRD